MAEIVFDQDPDHCEELLSAFVSQLFLQAEYPPGTPARQAEGIAKAKARGVQFGTRRRELPDNFDQVRKAWRSGGMNLKEAAKLYGLPTTTFYDAVCRAEQGTEEQAAN